MSRVYVAPSNSPDQLLRRYKPRGLFVDAALRSAMRPGLLGSPRPRGVSDCQVAGMMLNEQIAEQPRPLQRRRSGVFRPSQACHPSLGLMSGKLRPSHSQSKRFLLTLK